MTMQPSSNIKTVALIGAGAVGLCLATAFAKAGWQVVVCGARQPFAQIEETEGAKTHTHRIRHALTPAEIGECDTVVLAVKSHQTQSVSHWLQAFNRASATLLVAQNGLGQKERVASFAPQANILPVIVYFNAQRSGPGKVVLKHIGEHDLCLPDTATAHCFADSLQKGNMRVQTTADITTALWLKLLANITANPITALTGRSTGVMQDPAILETARQIMAEAVKVGQAEGAKLTTQHIENSLAWLQTISAESITSMLQDRQAGRALEYGALTGQVVKAGKKHGIETPLNSLVLSLLSAIHPISC
ncbi:ketopantoate reductase [Acetobacter pomorum]|uniref:2-dehydropantoate 2-reductase n=1 Tax=Acetobacter pomorum TaxID=65959 RepID=A0A2G4RBJ9_9PROT|nr:2-dehydropantoate 2-reductase [Acetobacter pomorum]PHY93887.1 ketopantoate reductase [Acetobacter pomorum]GBR53942.1 ketopantoate reductase ApbA/PanE [Acetobacter pomorum DSM 11825]